MATRFLPFLAACLGISSLGSATIDPAVFAKVPGKDKERRKFRSKRDRTTKSMFGRRWSWGTPHVGAQQSARLARRAEKDAYAAKCNYPGWCGRAANLAKEVA